MARTNAEIIGMALVRGNVTTTTAGMFTDSIMNRYYNEAHRWACSYHKWPFTEGRYSTTWTGGEEVNYPEGWKSDAIRYLEIGSEELKKINFYDYKRYREDNDSGEDRVFTDHFRILYVNPNADVSGTLTAYGQYTPAEADWTAAAVVTQFSDADDDGNEAITERVLAYMKEREKKFSESKEHERKALEILDRLWSNVGGERTGYKPHDSSAFERVDILNGDYYADTLKRDQFF